MKKIISLASVLLLAACAGGSYDRWDGSGLTPGASTRQDVERVMGTPRETRPGPDGSTVLWFPRLPAGRVSFAATVGSDGKLLSIEQRLTRENMLRLRPGESRQSDVRDLLGPPGRVTEFPRRQRTAWTYQIEGIQPQVIVTEFSGDGILREAFIIDDPEMVDRRM